MGTRAVYTFIDEDDRHSVYKHWDGYRPLFEGTLEDAQQFAATYK